MERSTKDAILDIAVDMFADRGYNKVTIRDIANAVGIKGSSIYNHFKSKEDIMEKVLDIYREQSEKYFGSFYMEMNLDELIETVPVEELLEKSLLMSVGFMELPKVNKLFRIITSELAYSKSCREFFLEEFITAPKETLTEIFTKLMKKGRIIAEDPELLAMEFYSFVIYKFYEDYILKDEKNMDFVKMRKEFTRHIGFFTSMVKSGKEI